MFNLHPLLIGVAVLLAGAALPTAAHADVDDTSKTKGEITQFLHSVEQALARGDNETQVAKMLYADNVLMTGEGEEGGTRGITAAIADVKGWMESLGPGGAKTCRYTVVDPVVATSTTFASFLVLRCKANPPVLPDDQVLRMMYAWKKMPQGWRVVLEMWAPGKL
jgi:hypothetical protein